MTELKIGQQSIFPETKVVDPRHSGELIKLLAMYLAEIETR